jgi:hypothetical protein
MLPHGDDSTIDDSDSNSPVASDCAVPRPTTSPDRVTTNRFAPADTRTCTPSPTATADDTGLPRSNVDAAVVYVVTAVSTQDAPTVCRDSVMRYISGVVAPVKYAAVSVSKKAKACVTPL